MLLQALQLGLLIHMLDFVINKGRYDVVCFCVALFSRYHIKQNIGVYMFI